MLRIVQMLVRNDSNYNLVVHGGDRYTGPYGSSRIITLLYYFDHVPFTTSLMCGETLDYDSAPDYWVTDLTGLLAGIDNQYFPVPGPERVLRQMLFASTCVRGPATEPARLWGSLEDDGIQDGRLVESDVSGANRPPGGSGHGLREGGEDPHCSGELGEGKG